MTTQTQHAGPDERAELIARMLEIADRQFSSNRPIYHTVDLLRKAAALLAADSKACGEVVAWRDYVEQRLLNWRQRQINRSGDRLALDDFMDKTSLEDLIDYVCSEYEGPADTHLQQQAAQAQHAGPDDRSELLPCPFCGAGSSEIVENGKVWTGMKYGEPSSVSIRHHCETIQGQPSRMLERVGRDRASAIAAWNMRSAALLAADSKAGGEVVAWLYTLEYGDTVANTKVSLHQLNYPFGVAGADYLRENENGVSYVRQTKLYK